MRILHTSDWHLGRSFHREDLLSAQAAFLDFLVETVRRERVDVVVVAGDLYDRALPGVDAVRLCNEALCRLADTGARTIVISGNHDSAARLGFGARLFDAARVHIRTDPRRCSTPVLVEDEFGSVAFYAIPYLEPEAAQLDLADCTERSHGGVLTAAMTAARADLVVRPAGTRSVAVAHAFVAGGAESDSERDIRVGGACAVPPAVFAGMDYVALGHLHGAQQVTGHAYYSGSPLAYSFSEARQRKSVHMVELGRRAVTAREVVPCPVPRSLGAVRGRLEDLLGDPALSAVEQSWLTVTLTDAVRPREPMERLRARFPHVLVLGFDPEGGQPRQSAAAPAVHGRTDVEIAEEFVRHVRGAPADEAERLLLREAVEAGSRRQLTPAGG